MFLVISGSLNPKSRSRVLGRDCFRRLQAAKHETKWFDLCDTPLPPCDGGAAYGHENVQALSKLIGDAKGIFIASPVYNFDVNSVVKNAVELTGRAWTGKVVAMMMSAGGQGSYMSGMGLANSLMLDFRCIIVPRFVYTTEAAIEGDKIVDSDLSDRMAQLVTETTKIANALAQ